MKPQDETKTGGRIARPLIKGALGALAMIGMAACSGTVTQAPPPNGGGGVQVGPVNPAFKYPLPVKPTPSFNPVDIPKTKPPVGPFPVVEESTPLPPKKGITNVGALKGLSI